MAALNASGHRLSLGPTDSDRLRDINERWSAARSGALQQCTRVQRQALSRQTFGEKCREWLAFLAQTERDLASDDSGVMGSGYEALCTKQLLYETFNTDMCSRQQILYCILSEGRQMVENGDIKDVGGDFKRKLDALEQQWPNLVQRVGQRKRLVDSKVALWQTYRKLMTELNEKMDELTRIQPPLKTGLVTPLEKIKQQLDGYMMAANTIEKCEPTFQRAGEYMALLSSTADKPTANQLQVEMQTLQARRDQIRRNVAAHTTQMEAILTLRAKIQTNLDAQFEAMKLMKKSVLMDDPIPERYEDLEKELINLQSTQSTMSSSLDNYNELERDFDKLAACVSPDDTGALGQRLKLLGQQRVQVNEQLARKQRHIRARMNQWTEFSDTVEQMINKLGKLQNKMTARSDLTMEDMIVKLQNEHKAEMSALEREKDKLLAVGRQLAENSSDLRANDVKHKMDDVAEKWRSLEAAVKAKMNKLSGTLATIEQLERNMHALRKWLVEAEHRATSPLVYQTCDMAEIRRHQNEQQDLQVDVERHSAAVASVLSLCDVLPHDLDACPTESESQDILLAKSALEQRWRNISTLVAQRKLAIDETQQLWHKLSVDCQNLNDWLIKLSAEVESLSREPVTFKSNKEQLTRAQTQQSTLEKRRADLDQLNRLYSRLAREGRTDVAETLQRRTQDVNRQWDALSTRMTAVIQRLRRSLETKEEFDTTRLALIAWLGSVSDRLQELPFAAQTRRDRVIQTIRRELEDQSPRLQAVDKAAEYIMSTGRPEDKMTTQQDVQELNTLYAIVLAQLDDLQHKPQQTELAVFGDDDVIKMEVQLETSMNAVSAQLQSTVNRTEDGTDGRARQRRSRENSRRGSRSEVIDEQAIALQRSELEKLEQWLYEAEAVLHQHRRQSVDIPQLLTGVNAYKTLLADISRMRPTVALVRSSTRRVAQHTRTTESLCDRISAAGRRWDLVCERVDAWRNALQVRLIQGSGISQAVEELFARARGAHREINLVNDGTGQNRTEVDRNERLRNVRREVSDIRAQVVSLCDIVEYLLSDDPSPTTNRILHQLADFTEELDCQLQLCDDLSASPVSTTEHTATMDLRNRLERSEGYFTRKCLQPPSAHDVSEDVSEPLTTDNTEDASTELPARRLFVDVGRVTVPVQLVMLLLLTAASLLPVGRGGYSMPL